MYILSALSTNYCMMTQPTGVGPLAAACTAGCCRSKCLSNHFEQQSLRKAHDTFRNLPTETSSVVGVDSDLTSPCTSEHSPITSHRFASLKLFDGIAFVSSSGLFSDTVIQCTSYGFLTFQSAHDNNIAEYDTQPTYLLQEAECRKSDSMPSLELQSRSKPAR